MKIKNIDSIEVLDSRGRPTLCTTIVLDDGCKGTAFVPSGASTGSLEAHELRDNEERYGGLGVQNASENAKKLLEDLDNKRADDQASIDKLLIEIDGTSNKSKIGANAILSVSIACTRAAANSLNLNLYEYLNILYKKQSNLHTEMSMPRPMLNIFNGGSHSNNDVDIQEFMIIPSSDYSFRDGLMNSVSVYAALKRRLSSSGLSVSVGDEGGFSPNLGSTENVLEEIIASIKDAGLKHNKDMFIALDCAATELFDSGIYTLTGENKKMQSDEMVEYIQKLIEKYEITSVEDPFDEKDWKAWQSLTEICKDTQIVGDDIFVTQKDLLNKGITTKAANAILIKPNQVGTITECFETIKLAQENNIKTIISHRSGETEDSFIADLSVAVDAKQIKTGAPARSDRTAKYNRLLMIENELYP